MLGQTGSEGSTGLRSLAICREYRRRRLRKRKRCAIADWTGVFRRIIHDFADWDGFFFLLVSFVFCFFPFRFRFFFFGTRLLTLRNLRYVATRLPQNDWTATQNRVNYDVIAQAPLGNTSVLKLGLKFRSFKHRKCPHIRPGPLSFKVINLKLEGKFSRSSELSSSLFFCQKG